MLIISRKKDEKIILADDIEITILEVGKSRVRFGIKAPKHISVRTHLKTTPIPEKTEVSEVVTGLPRRVPLRILPTAVRTSKRR